MEQDPLFKQMVSKSHILKKIDNLKIPMVPKEPKIKHHALTTFLVASTIHCIIYPLDTIKTRLIAQSKVDDVSRYNLNKVGGLTTYLGIFKGYGALVISNVCHLTIGKESLVLSCLAQSLLKTWVDISKINKQMGNIKGDYEIMKKSYPLCLSYAFVRDLIYRGIYLQSMIYYKNKQQKISRFRDQRKKMNTIFLSTIVATVISHPFDVCFTKIASQRHMKYSNIFKTPLLIGKQQSIGKLLLSGFWARMSYNLLSMLLLSMMYQGVLQSTLQAY